ncbi:hypothetical protein MMC13_006006 [Lambiella insularis]|nr:hypothetical protein [Lambiella insularis]
MDSPAAVSGQVEGNRYGFHTAMFEPFRREPHDSPRTAPTALMVDPNPSYRQAQDAADQQEGSIPESTQLRAWIPQPTSEMARCLPLQNITQESADDAYVQFIFYCNPSIPLTTDATELRKGFRSMPKTDGKSFDTFVAFQLIKKLEAKEIETWSQLVTELGVEPPDLTKNQSSQKVQQFAVRLKRWLHAFHIDAFFQYCLGKPNPYFIDLPPAEEGISDRIRDGVPPEEDLALRALLPEWRPKRGRRKIDPNDGDPSTPSKRVRREGSLNVEDLATPQDVHSAHPQSAFAWNQPSRQDDPWAAAQRALLPKSGSGNNQPQSSSESRNFWADVPDTTPSIPYPQSAVTLRHSQSVFPSQESPQSAHPFGSHRGRKRHGPAVSAAWISAGHGKLPRGRPPNNRSVQDGPFSTFPANPQPKTLVAKSTGTPSHTAHPEPNSPTLTVNLPQTIQPVAVSPASATITNTPTKRPSKLSLQVPQNAGGPVRLATPPPKVLVNGEDGAPNSTNAHRHERRSSADFFNSIDDEVSEIADDSDDDGDRVYWKRRALLLKRKLMEKEAELKLIRRRVMEAVM